MYCHNCGEEQIENAQFCHSCGGAIKSLAKGINLGIKGNTKSIFKLFNERLELTLGTKIEQSVYGYYIAWIVIHFLLLIFNTDGSSYSNEYFWPFSKSELRYYDWREFIVYVFAPIVLVIIYSLIKNESTSEITYDLEYKNELDIGGWGWIGIVFAALLGLADRGIITGIAWPISPGLASGLDSDSKFWGSIFLFAVRIGYAYLSGRQAIRLNRNVWVWGVLGFFIPFLTVLVISKKRKILLSENKDEVI